MRIDEPLVVYRYHQDSESFNIDRHVSFSTHIGFENILPLLKIETKTHNVSEVNSA